MPRRTSDQLGYPAIEMPAHAMTSSDSVIRYLIGQLAEQGRIPPESAALAVCQVVTRERQGSTVLPTGIAVPHSKMEIPEPVGIIGRSSVPIPWESRHEVDVYEVCLLLLPVYDPKEYMRALKQATEILSS